MLSRIKINDLPGSLRVKKIMDLIVQSRPREWATDYPNIQDLHELLLLKDVKEQTAIWRDDANNLIAFCLLDPYYNLIFECADNLMYPSLFKEAVELCETAIKKKNINQQVYPTLDVSCRRADHQRIKCLKLKGFEPEAVESIFFERPLENIPSQVTYPPGYLIRPLAGKQEISAYVDLHQKAFGTSQMTIELRQSIMTSPEYDPQLDLVIQASDGQLVAFCVCQINDNKNNQSTDKAGWTDPIGVHPDFRHLGLAKALMQEGLSLLKMRGIKYARLGTSSDNLPMISLAERMGFLETDRKLWFSRKVS